MKESTIYVNTIFIILVEIIFMKNTVTMCINIYISREAG